MEEKLMKALCDSLHYIFDEDACVSTLDIKKSVTNLLAAGVTVPVRCKDCIWWNTTGGMTGHTWNSLEQVIFAPAEKRRRRRDEHDKRYAAG